MNKQNAATAVFSMSHLNDRIFLYTNPFTCCINDKFHLIQHYDFYQTEVLDGLMKTANFKYLYKFVEFDKTSLVLQHNFAHKIYCLYPELTSKNYKILVKIFFHFYPQRSHYWFDRLVHDMTLNNDFDLIIYFDKLNIRINITYMTILHLVSNGYVETFKHYNVKEFLMFSSR